MGGLQTHYYVTPVQDFEGYAEVMLGLACYIYLGKVKKFGDIIGNLKVPFGRADLTPHRRHVNIFKLALAIIS